MIINTYDNMTEPLISLKDFYGEPGNLVDKCIITFSHVIYEYILENFECELIAEIGGCDGKKPIYKFNYDGMSYHYAPVSDYITIKNSNKLAEIFMELGIPFVQGRVWTTDAMLRETKGNVAKRI